MMVNVLMMGGRRSGKTSLSASMDNVFSDLSVRSGVLDAVINQGEHPLRIKPVELKRAFHDPITITAKRLIFDSNPASVINEYIFGVRTRDKKEYNISFTDVSGQFYSMFRSDSDPENSFICDYPKLAADKQILMIAVDTPHMIESPYDKDGVCEYHREFNCVDEITDFIRTYYSADKDMLVIFVPLKCEKYFHNGEADRIPEYIMKGYPDLFDYFRSSGNEERFSVVIDPVLTLGGIEFSEFEEENPCPCSVYKFVEAPGSRMYSPEYCDIPVYLIILYLIRAAKKIQEKPFFSRTLDNLRDKSFFPPPRKESIRELVNAEKIVKDLINKNKPQGFKVIQDPLGLGL